MTQPDLINKLTLLCESTKYIGRSRTGEWNAHAKQYFNLIKQFDIEHKEWLSPAGNIWCIINDVYPQCKECKAYLTNFGVSGPKRQFCSMKCMKLNKEQNDKISLIKKTLYSNSEWKTSVETKRMNTCLSRYNVKYVMQDPTIFKKHLTNSFKKTNIDGMYLLGYEPFILNYLKLFDYTVHSGVDYIKENGIKIIWHDNNTHYAYPDFYIEELSGFVEVKGTYTRNKDDHKIKMIRNSLRDLNLSYYVLTYKHKVGIIIETLYEHKKDLYV